MPEPTLKRLPDERFGPDEARHLQLRAGFGGTAGQTKALADMGLDRAVDHFLNAAGEAIAADQFDRTIVRPATQEEREEVRTARQRGDEAALERYRRAIQQRQRADRRQLAEIQQWWLDRMITTPAPLEERMTLFWHGHFATAYRPIEDSYHLFLQNQLFRTEAVGNFGRLAHGIIRDPAMLAYLNNNRNVQRRPNENLARELMELFTMGEGNGYTERDIREAARALTGYAFEDDAFEFRAPQHDGGQKTILGRSGAWNGHDLVDIILAQPVTAEFITLKLYRHFVNDLPGGPDTPTQEFIRRLAAQMRRGGYDLKPVLRTLLRSAHFYDPANRGGRIRGPVELIVQSIRSLQTPTRSSQVLIEAAAQMGQDLFQPPSVKGWDGGRAWINTSTLFARQNTLIYLLTGRMPGGDRRSADHTRYESGHLLAPLSADLRAIEPREGAAYLLRFMLGAPPSDERVTVITDFVHSCGGHFTEPVITGAVSIIAAMPEYQLC